MAGPFTLRVKLNHVTEIPYPVGSLLQDSIANAIDTIPSIYPEAVAYSDQFTGRVSSTVDTTQQLSSVLDNQPLMITYDIPKPLFTTDLRSKVAALEAESMDQRRELRYQRRKLEDQRRKLEDQRRKVEDQRRESKRQSRESKRQGRESKHQRRELEDWKRESKYQRRELMLLKESTHPIIPISLRTILDAHLMKLGFSKDGGQTRAEFIAMNQAAIASALGVHPDDVGYIFRNFHKEGVTSAHTATSLTVADAITQGGLSLSDSSMWQHIFKHTFGRSINCELEERGRSVWKIDAHWETLPRNRFVFFKQG